MIKRKIYLEDIISFYDEELIKVIIDIRRCGKSILLGQIVEELSMNVDKEYIIYINFEDVFYSDIYYIISLSIGKKVFKKTEILWLEYIISKLLCFGQNVK